LRAQFSGTIAPQTTTAPAPQSPPAAAPTTTAEPLTPARSADRPLVLSSEDAPPDSDGQDILANAEVRAIQAVRNAPDIQVKLQGAGMSWGSLLYFIKDAALPQTMDDAAQVAYNMVPKVMSAVYGPQNTGWHGFKNNGKTWIKKGPRPA